MGSGLQSAAVDLSAYAGTETPIRVIFVLKGRGLMPASVSKRLVDARHENPLSLTKLQGTGLILDNIRLNAAGDLPAIPDINNITISLPENGSVLVSGPVSSVSANANVYAHGNQSGVRHQVTASEDGSFQMALPALADVPTFYVLNYSTPKTTTDNTSNRLFSQNISLRIDPN